MYTKIRFAVAAAFLIVAASVGLVTPTTEARLAPTDTINPTQITMNAGSLPTAEFVDYSLVFH
jgi:hypothetical protein